LEKFRSKDQVREFAASQKSEERRAREKKKEQEEEEESSQHKAHILLQPESQTVATAASIHSPPNKNPATNFLTLEIAISMTTVEEEKEQATRVFPGTAASGSAQPAFTDESRNRLRQKKRIGQTNKQARKIDFRSPEKRNEKNPTNKQTNKSSAPPLDKRQLTIDKTTTSTTTTRSVSVC
jgi:hypothetical protein